MGLGPREIITGFFVSTLWLSVAFMVAYPDYVLEWRFTQLSMGFVNGERDEIYYLPFLILVDFFISLVLNHYRPTKFGALTIAACSIIYFIIAAALSRQTEVAGTPAAVLFVVCVGLLLAVRFVSFLSPSSDGKPLRVRPFGE